jgi:YesN/AraC family two-component response regulator
MESIKVLIVDDHSLFRDGLRAMIDSGESGSHVHRRGW